MLILKDLKIDVVSRYLKHKLLDEMRFSSLVSEKLDFKKGSFYTIVPEGLAEKALYNFKYGGYVYPFKKEAYQTLVKTENIAKNILLKSIYQFLSLSKTNCLGIEDFNADPNSSYIKKANLKYSIVDDRLFYLLDKSYTYKDIVQYLNISGGYIFYGLFLNFKEFEIEGLKNGYYKQMLEENINVIFNSIEALFLEVYDGESYVFWLKNDQSDLKEILLKCICEENEN